MVSRTAYMIEQGIPADNILMFTFTRKAAEELKVRIAAKVGNASKSMTVSTYHSFCAKLLRKYCTVIGYKNNFTIYDDEDKMNMINGLLDRLKNSDEDGDSDEFSSSSDKFSARELGNQISYWKENMVSPLEAPSQCRTNLDRKASKMYQLYQEKLMQSNALDFDDLLYLTIKILENNSVVLNEVNKQYRYIVVDESQDSGAGTDYRLIQLLAGPNKDNWNLCLVGDDCQSKL